MPDDQTSPSYQMIQQAKLALRQGNDLSLFVEHAGKIGGIRKIALDAGLVRIDKDETFLIIPVEKIVAIQVSGY